MSKHQAPNPIGLDFTPIQTSTPQKNAFSRHRDKDSPLEDPDDITPNDSGIEATPEDAQINAVLNNSMSINVDNLSDLLGTLGVNNSQSIETNVDDSSDEETEHTFELEDIQAKWNKLPKNSSLLHGIAPIDLQYSFLLHEFGMSILYSKNVREAYTPKKTQHLAQKGLSDIIKDRIVAALIEAIRDLCLSIYNEKQPYDLAQMNILAQKVYSDPNVQKEIRNLADKVIEHRVFGRLYSTKIHDIVSDNDGILFSVLMEKFKGLSDNPPDIVHNSLNAVVNLAVEKLAVLKTYKADKTYENILRSNTKREYLAPIQYIRDQSYEQILYRHNQKYPDKRQESSQLAKAAWDIIRDLSTNESGIIEKLAVHKAKLFSCFIRDIEASTDQAINSEFQKLKKYMHPEKLSDFINHIYQLIEYNLSNIRLDRITLNNSFKLMSTSFREVLANIRLSNRSIIRSIRNFEDEEGTKVRGETFARNWGFSERSRKCALETQEISSNKARTDLVVNMGSYESVLQDIEKLKIGLNITDKDIAIFLKEILNGKPVEFLKKADGSILTNQAVYHGIFVNITALMFITETSRNPASSIANLMILDLIEGEKISWEKALDSFTRMVKKGTTTKAVSDGGLSPMSMDKAAETARFLHRIYGGDYRYPGSESDDSSNIRKLIERESKVVQEWLAFKVDKAIDKTSEQSKQDPISSFVEMVSKNKGSWLGVV